MKHKKQKEPTSCEMKPAQKNIQEYVEYLVRYLSVKAAKRYIKMDKGTLC